MKDENSLKSYLIDQLYIAKQNVVCIGSEGDTEPLHHFRVALRRFRSVLGSYTKKRCTSDAIAKSMLQVTNPLRELDVFLASLEEKNYPRIYKRISRYRQSQYKQWWTSQTVTYFEETLQTLIDDISASPLECSKKKLIKRAEELYVVASTSHKKLTSKSLDAQIHKCRIRYKKARYVLEFLRYSGVKDAHAEISRLKKVLDHFGAIQDISNQIEWLECFCEADCDDTCQKLDYEKKQKLIEMKREFSDQSAQHQSN